MRNPKTRALYHYWNGLRQGREVPCRNDIEPRQIKSLLPDIFILEQFDDDHLVFRLAGTRLCEFYGREFRAHNYLSLWRGTDRLTMQKMMQEVLEKKVPGVAICSAETLDHLSIDIEILALPLLDYYGNVTRIIGSVQMLSEPDVLGHRIIVAQWISSTQIFDGSDTSVDEGFDQHRPPRADKPFLRLVSTRSDN